MFLSNSAKIMNDLGIYINLVGIPPLSPALIYFGLNLGKFAFSKL